MVYIELVGLKNCNEKEVKHPFHQARVTCKQVLIACSGYIDRILFTILVIVFFSVHCTM